jgi:hypothetical protein
MKKNLSMHENVVSEMGNNLESLNQKLIEQ